MKRAVLGVLIGTLAIVAGAAGDLAPVRADQSLVPSQQPLTTTPRVIDGRIYAIVVSGNAVMVGGTFTQMREGTSTTAITQPYLFKFDITTGRVDPAFRPALNGAVEGLRYSPDGRSIYVAGSFTLVGGVSRQRIVKLDAATGAIDPTFVASANQTVRDLDLVGNTVIVGGSFRIVNGQVRERLAMLDAATGQLRPNPIPVLQSRDEFAPYVQELDVSDDGRWLVIVGNFITVGGQPREQVAVIDLAGATPTVANWQTTRFQRDCAGVYDDTWMRGVHIAPSNQFFVIGTTGAYLGTGALCDTATRWELPPARSGTGLEPTWTTHTGGDTHWAMHVTSKAVFAGGHQRWENNPHPSPGGDNDGPGSLSRPGIAALDPLTGVPLSWNPTRDRGRGVEAFWDTPQHLYVGSDTNYFAGTLRQRLAVLPVAGGFDNPDPQVLTAPVDLRYSVGDRLYRTRFDGSTFTAPVQVGGTGINGDRWTTVRDGFLQAGRLHYFGPNQAFFRTPLTNNAMGAQTNLSTSVGYVDVDRNLTPYDQPYGVAATKSATYHRGRIYYTRTDSSRLFWRWYSLQSGVIGAEEYVASTASWSNAVAFEVVDGWLLAARSNNTLTRVRLNDTGGVNATTAQTVATGGPIPWSSIGAMFASPASGALTTTAEIPAGPPAAPDTTGAAGTTTSTTTTTVATTTTPPVESPADVVPDTTAGATSTTSAPVVVAESPPAAPGTGDGA